MTTIASQIVLHPTVSQALRLLSTTVGRDKIYRAVQYFARFFAWILIKQGNGLQAARWDALKSHLGTARKLMRLGKPLEHLQAALKAVDAGGKAGEQTTTVLRQLGYASYLFFDGIVWANSAKFITLSKENAQKYARRANRFWFLGILFSIFHGMIKTSRLASQSKRLIRPSWGEKGGDEAARSIKLAAVQKERMAVRYQFVLDLLDIWIPAAGLNYVNLNDGVLGIFGFITSVMALRTQWEAAAK